MSGGVVSVKFILGISKNLGLEKFTNEDYEFISINLMKPILVTFILEAFWKSNLQNQYAFCNRMKEYLKKN